MTNILDSVEPDAFVEHFQSAEEGHTEELVWRKSEFENPLAFVYENLYSRETVDRLLAEHRKQVLLAAADRLESQEFCLSPESNNTYSASAELRRMAEGEK